MKKILLTIFTIILILSINVLAVDIDVGSPAINRDAFVESGYTYVLKDNLANADGKIESIEIYTGTALTGCTVATFYVVDGSTLAARDSHYIGNVSGWSKQTISGLDIEINTGDYIGIYFSGGKVECNESGFAGIWYKSGDYTSGQTTFSLRAGDTISLYGTGATEVGWSHKWNTQTISKWNTKEFTKWNDLE